MTSAPAIPLLALQTRSLRIRAYWPSTVESLRGDVRHFRGPTSISWRILKWMVASCQ